MRHATLLAVLGFVALAVSCHRQDASRTDAVPETASPKDSGTAAAQQKLVRTARIELEVESVEASISEVQGIAQNGSGTVFASDIRRVGGRLRAALTIHVPSDRVDTVLSALRRLGQVESENVSTQDVTKAYFDLETRLRVKRQTEDRLREILRTRTGELSQVLEVERELDRVVGQIEEMEGERRFYDEQIAVSTINVQLVETGASMAPGILSKVRSALRDSVSLLSTSFAALVYFIAFFTPWLILIAAVVWLVSVIKKWRRRE